jgi:hypothetical protein
MQFGLPLLLEEAIEEEKKSAKQAKDVGALNIQKYHEQLVGWLTELKKYREVNSQRNLLKVGGVYD